MEENKKIYRRKDIKMMAALSEGASPENIPLRDYTSEELAGATQELEADDKPKPIPWGEFEKIEFPQQQYRINNLVPEGGFIIIASPSGEKKTWIALSMAKSIACGTSFLNNENFETIAGNVLYIDQEMPKRELQRRGKQRLSSFSYTLDSLGNRTQILRDSRFTNLYTYDALSQLLSENRGGTRTTYIYDAVGNRLSRTRQNQTLNSLYDAANRLLQAGKTAFTYDANGNRIAMDGGPRMEYRYDAANRLIQISQGGRLLNYFYDGDGNKVARAIGNQENWFINDVATALPVILTENDHAFDTNYTYGLGLISKTDKSSSHFYHYDGLGSVVNLSNSSGGPAASYDYDAWGEPLGGGNRSTVHNRFRFTGEEVDDSTGLYYLRARWYDPSVGRFLSKDIFGGFLMSPLSLNKHIYALNNPVRLVDPAGLSAQDFPSSSFTQLLVDYFKLASNPVTRKLLRQTILAAATYRTPLTTLAPYNAGLNIVQTINQTATQFQGPLTVLSIANNTVSEFQSLNLTSQDVLEGWRNAGQNIAFGLSNPDSLLNSLTTAVNSTSAIVFNTIADTFGVNAALRISGVEPTFTGQTINSFFSNLLSY